MRNIPYLPQCPDVQIAHAPFAVVSLIVAALVGVDNSIIATFDLDTFTRLGSQVRVLSQPFVRPCHKHAAQCPQTDQLVGQIYQPHKQVTN